MKSKFLETIKKYGLLDKRDKVLVGVSGGPDSLALLLLLNSLKKKWELSLHIAHMDHMLRPGSHKDAAFVKKLGEKLDIPVTIKSINLKSRHIKGSLEELAREARLDFLIKLARQIRADKIALGHNLDDQAETVLMRLLRGTGLSGLSGISAKRNIRGAIFIRPLLETRRQEIESFLKRKKIRPRIDPTNKEDIFMRNRIRHSLIPLLKSKYNKNITELLANLAESISYDYEYLDAVARLSLKGSKLRLNAKKALSLHPALLRLKIRQTIAHLQGDTRRITFQHIREIEDLLAMRPDGSVVDLPKGISVQKTRNFLRFYPR